MSKRNILFINTDQLRADVLGCHGYPLNVTPNIDKLAADGAVFQNCFTQSPVCTPARYSLLSGQYLETTGVLGNGHRPHPELKSLIDRFNDAGYHTLAMGKLHHVPYDSPFGFKEVVLHDGGLTGRVQCSAYYQLLHEKGVIDLNSKRPLEIVSGPADIDTDPIKKKCKNRVHWGTSQLPEELSDISWLASTVIDRLEKWDSDQPLFLYASFVAPHSPYLASKPYDTMFDPDDIPMPNGMFDEDLNRKNPGLAGKVAYYGDIFDEPTVRSIRAAYLGVVVELDHHIGRIIQTFKEKFGDEYIIALTSDHGDFLGEHGLCEKHFHYDTADRVPCVLSAPGIIEKGKKTDSQVEQIDMLPSVMEMTGVDYEKMACAGVPIDVPAVNQGDFPGKPYVFSQIKSYGVYSVMVRGTDFKLIASVDLDDHQLYWELYDLKNDPFEQNNLIDKTEFSPKVRELKDALLNWSVKVHSTNTEKQDN